MLEALLLTLAISGQTPHAIPEGALQGASHIVMHMGNIQEKSRFYAELCYETNWVKVPIVNGYAPGVSFKYDRYGRKVIVYDYRRKIPYSKCYKKGDLQSKKNPVPEEEKPFVPTVPEKDLSPSEDRPLKSIKPPDYDPFLRKPSEIKLKGNL